MTIQDWAGLTLSVLSILAITFSAIRWYVQTQTAPLDQKIEILTEAIADIRAETKTNGGSSMRDEIKFIKKENEIAKSIREEQKQKLDHMYDILLEYIAKNSK